MCQWEYRLVDEEASNSHRQAVKQDQLPPAKEYVEASHTAILFLLQTGFQEMGIDTIFQDTLC